MIVVVIVVVVGIVAIGRPRSAHADAPTQRRFAVPQQLDRADFARPDAPWLVAVFSSATCDVCRSVVDKARVLESSDVAVVDVEYLAARALHERYSIEAVPTVVVADAQRREPGRVHRPDVGDRSVGGRRRGPEPGSSPEPNLGQHADLSMPHGDSPAADVLSGR